VPVAIRRERGFPLIAGEVADPLLRAEIRRGEGRLRARQHQKQSDKDKLLNTFDPAGPQTHTPLLCTAPAKALSNFILYSSAGSIPQMGQL
jgi:hypothetical protein